MTLRILKLPAKDRTGKSTSTIYDEMSRGVFPRQVKIGPKAVGWLETEIDDHIASQIAARDGKAA